MGSSLLYCNWVQAKKKPSFVSVIMAGGQGTRFWPLSRKKLPKQFLPVPPQGDVSSAESLISATANRMSKLQRISSGNDVTLAEGLDTSTLIVTGIDHFDLVRERLPGVSVLGEPIGRNTAPCAVYAARLILDTLGDIPMLMLPADHLIANEAELLRLYSVALKIVESQDVLLTIGIKPVFPEVGYGYVQRGDGLKGISGQAIESAYAVRRFVEKPDYDTAQRYVESGDYYWNSGMFGWRPSVFLREVERHLPELGKQMSRLSDVWPTSSSSFPCNGEQGSEDCGHQRFVSLAREVFHAITPVSIDVGIMEKAKNVVMLTESEDSIGWSDVGSWSAWADAANGSQSKSNVVHADKTLLFESNGCVVVGGERLIAGIGLEDLVIIDTPDAVLVVPKNRTQEVRRIVDELKSQGRFDLL